MINDKELQEKETKQLRQAIEGQNEIGWVAMLQGYIHVSWANTQDKYYRRMGWNKSMATVTSQSNDRIYKGLLEDTK